MARNAHPEETRTRILDTAEVLFASKGYANTSVQDIVDALGNLSKGAIYHHFDSKLDILLALNERDNAASEQRFEAVMKRTDLNGLQKIQESLRAEISDTHHQQQIQAFAPVLGDPENFLVNVKNWATTVPQEIYLPLIQEGIADGSITTDYPEEAAQLLGLMLNLWFLPPVFSGTRSQTKHRMECLAVMLESIGVPVFTVKLVNDVADFYCTLGEDGNAANAGKGNVDALLNDLHEKSKKRNGGMDAKDEKNVETGQGQ